MHQRSIVKGLPLSGRKPAVRLLAITGAAVMLLSVSPGVLAQAAQPSASTVNQAEVWTRASLDKQFAAMVGTAKAKGSAERELGVYNGHDLRLSCRTANGQVEVHNHSIDVIFVVKGQATLLTGGTVIGGKPGADGEIRGISMRGGVRRTISAGDLVHVSAGVAHQMLLQPGALFEAEIVKVRVTGK